ncbi:MAG: cupin domain-containing protein [Solirubrobacterales bacterium]|nr:cupin domain-containing protein [Solirubrobacterales bacterium]
MRTGDVVWNELTGEKAMIVESGEETEGARVVADFAVEKGGFVPGGEHVHDHCTEQFEVSAGTIAFLRDGEQITLGAGEQLTVRPGSWHRWWNAGETEVRIRATVEPALSFEQAILVFWGLCTDGHTNAEGRPSPLFGAMVATAYRRELRLRPPPDAVQRLLFPPLAAIGRRRGLQRTIDRYLDLATHPSAEAGRGSLPKQVMRRVG